MPVRFILEIELDNRTTHRATLAEILDRISNSVKRGDIAPFHAERGKITSGGGKWKIVYKEEPDYAE